MLAFAFSNKRSAFAFAGFYDMEHEIAPLVEMVRKILDRGVLKGVFRKGVDPVQLNITIAAIGYYYLTNQHTGSIIFKRDLMAPAALKQRLSFNVDTIMRLVSK